MKQLVIACLLLLLGWMSGFDVSLAAQRFPPPDFESGYQIPATQTPAARSLAWQYMDVAVLVVSLGLACYFILRKRSRKAVVGLSLFSLAYFGFYRLGCICAIGSIQNVAFGVFNGGNAVPFVALAFFLAPLLVALFAGRAFCAAVCPHGALQDLVLIRPLRVPRWLEQGLGLVPYLYLGAAVAFAATGSAFIICRYDPFVPLFRFSGSLGLLILGGAFLILAMFVGRPYCRFLCPFGALLKLAGKVSKWRVTITPNVCTQCRLCEEACPYGAIHHPVSTPVTPQGLRVDRRRLAGLLLLLPALLASGGWAGSKLATPASRLHPTIALSERYIAQQKKPEPLGLQTPAALALSRAEQDPKALLTQAITIRQQFVWVGWLFGAWVGLVIGVKLIGLSLRHRRTDYEPDRGDCLACARCFSFCPNERVRCGLAPITPAPLLRESGAVDPMLGPDAARHVSAPS